MKKLLLFAASAALIWACEKGNETLAGVEEKAELTVNLNGSQTRATDIMGDATDEAKVSNVQVFVFNGNAIDGYGTIDNAKTLSVSCTAGTRDIYAIVNASSLASVTTKEALLKSISTLKEGTYEMIGCETSKKIEKTSSISIDVNRIAARVVVRKITNSLSSPALQNQSFEVKKVYLSNVATKAEYDGVALTSGQVWKNQFGYQASNNLASFTNDDVTSGSVTKGNAYMTSHFLYAYPNAADYIPYTQGASFTARRTMLVVRIKIGETLYNYPIVLPALQSNKTYEIKDLIISRPGNKDDGEEGGEDEENPVTGSNATFTISINSWNTVLVTGEGESDGNYTI